MRRKVIDMPGNQNEARFYECVWPHRAVALRTAKILTSNDADAEDLAQEAMMKAFRSITSLREGGNPKAWLLTIVRHAHVDRVRAVSHRAECSLDAMEMDPVARECSEESDCWSNPEATLNSFSDQEMIDALKNLPQEIRWTLLLVDIEGLDDADAAAILNVPNGTIKSRLHRGRQMLRGVLAPMARELRLAVPA